MGPIAWGYLKLWFYSAPYLKGKSGELDIGSAPPSPAECTHLAVSEASLGENGSAGNTRLTGLLPAKKKNHFKIRLELCRNPNCRGCSRKAEGWIDPFLDWADFLFLFFFNPVPTASIPPRKPGAPPGPQLDRRTAEGPRCATRRESSPGCPRLCRELQQREIPDLFAAFVYNTQPNDKVKAVFLSVFLSARAFDGSCFHRIISWKKSTTVCCAIPQVDWIILKYFGQWSWNFDLTVINISFAGNINATACFFHGAALIWSHFLVCFGFGKAQIFFFLEYSRALWSTNVYGEHSKRADIKPSYLHVLLPFSSYIRATHSGQLPLLGDGRDQGTVPLPTPCWKKRSAKDKASEGFSGFLLVKKKGTGRIS